MHVLVTGGTGALGREVVRRLIDEGHRARVLSRKHAEGDDWVQGDLVTGAGLEVAVKDIDVIIHAASDPISPRKYQATDVLGTRRLLAMAREAGIRHVVYISIVGMEGVAYPYYKSKLEAEAVMRENIVPWSILRATQFHTLIDVFLEGMSRRLVDIATQAKPAGMLPDFGGPEPRDFKSLAASWLAARRPDKRLVNLPMPFKVSRQFSAGAALAPEHRDGTITFEQYLAGRYPKPT
ncbi:MAG: hypothetical protein AUH32_03665 [Actinobacteria bacterium 13_1_40CM_66_12]|nr:MAG: hypothetical protein AUH32_03665 [Actinobacteria bacterium 13_1_40CM_66_12]